MKVGKRVNISSGKQNTKIKEINRNCNVDGIYTMTIQRVDY